MSKSIFTSNLLTDHKHSEFRETETENDNFESPVVAAQLNTGFRVGLW